MTVAMGEDQRKLVFAVVFCFVSVVFGATDPNDFQILKDFKEGLENPELLKWPSHGDDPCGPPPWPYVFCKGNRVSQIQVQGLGLRGPLPQNFNQLKLENLGLQKNNFSGKLPTFSGLSELQYAYLDYNQFDTIPSDFFNDLSSLQVLALDDNPLKRTTGWSIPNELQNSEQLTNLSLMNCNLVGQIPDFLGQMRSLTALKLSYNNLSGRIPASFNQSVLQILWLNDQFGSKLSGPIDVVGSMVSMTSLWLHGNCFTGTIPGDIGGLSSLRDLNLNGNQLVGLVPESLASMQLDRLDLSNNMLMGPIPKFKSLDVSYSSNSFCQNDPGLQCAPEVTVLLDFLGGVNFPIRLAGAWSGNDPCKGQWLGLSCNPSFKVSVINLPRSNLSGTLSPSIGKLDSLTEIHLGANNLTGPIPTNLTELKSLKLLDVSVNNLEPPLPKFSSSVKVVIDGNNLLDPNKSVPQTPSNNPSSPSNSGSPAEELPEPKSSKRFKLVVIVAPIACFALLVLLVVPLSIYYCNKRKDTFQAPSSFVVHPRDPSDPENMVKIAVSNNDNGNLSTLTETSSRSSRMGESHVVEVGNLIISVQVLRNVTKNFAPENELGRGGFGAVYKGELDDGTKIAVKRMKAGVISSKALDEFQSEIAVLSKVRHRHLVSLLGYSIEGNERLLVYEYMPQGALSSHLFHWKSLKLEPLSWKRRLNIALDVARGMEYLHSLAHVSFVHRDLKSSNILLGDDYRAKVSDFGLVKLAPDREKLVVTRLAGTFGYLAPEYAGKQFFF